MTTAVAIQTVSRMKSPSLRAFESNPFRILRLPVTATTSAAAIQAESALTLSRVGLSPEEPDPLPWLPLTSPFELQQAAQSAEEPLIRLKWQLLWFDCQRDPKAQLLSEALANPAGESMRTYLTEELKLGEASADGDEGTANGLVAHAINQANLRLLRSSAATNGYFPTSGQQVVAATIPATKWKSLNGFRILPQPHTVFGGDGAGTAPWTSTGVDWQGALQRWSAILADIRFKSYLISCIKSLEDDFVSAEDVETVEESVRTYLADLAAQEARFFVIEGRYPFATSVISAVARSGMELRVIAPAMRPLRQVFQSEIAELETLVETPENSLDGIDAYVRRLEGIRVRWTVLDAGGVVGLRDILDQAVERAYLQLRSLEKPGPRVDDMLGKVTAMATADSLKERVKSYLKELEESRTRLCHFCKTGIPDYDKCAVLHGKKETGRTRKGRTTTIHYNVRYAIVFRCTRCAQLHGFISKVGIILWVASIPGIIAFLVLMFGGSS
jgi:hypothetical protein